MSLLSHYFVRENGVIRAIKRPITTLPEVIDALNAANDVSPIITIICNTDGPSVTGVIYKQIIDDEVCLGSFLMPGSKWIMSETPLAIAANRSYQIKPDGRKIQIVAHPLKHRYSQAHSGPRHSKYALTDAGQAMRIELDESDLISETPIERGADFDDWIAALRGTLVSRQGDIVRFSRGSEILADVQMSPTSWTISDDRFLFVVDGQIRKYDLKLIQYSHEPFESPVVQISGDAVLCEDGTVWLEQNRTRKLVDRVEYIEPVGRTHKKAAR